MNEEKYISERVDDQLEWYEYKAAINKRLFIWKETLVISFAAFIPFVIAIDPLGSSKIITALLGLLITVLSGVSTILKLEKKWTEYRTTAETIKHEKYLYFTKSSPYHNSNSAFNEFVQRIENIISKENTYWNQYIAKTENEKTEKNS